MLRHIFAASLVAIGFCLAPASAQEWPSQPIRMVVPYSPGAGNDILSRLTAEYLSKRLGPFVLDAHRGRRKVTRTA